MIMKTNFEFRSSETNILFTTQFAEGEIHHIFRRQLLIYSINSVGSKTLKPSVLD